MYRRNHIIRYGTKAFLYASAVGFWYLIMPDHYIQLITNIIIYGIIAMIFMVICTNVIAMAIKILRKRFKWGRRLFRNPQTMNRNYRD